jgi:hypothetical protein
VAETSPLDLDLSRLESELKRLEAEYTMFFSGRLPKPPSETRSRVSAIVRQYDRAPIQNYGARFRFSTLQARFTKLTELWDRALRAKEEGRPGPLTMMRRASPVVEDPPSKDRIVKVATFQDPGREIDELHELYDALVAARREAGQEVPPFRRFADLVTRQVATLQQRGSSAVAFRVGLKDGKVTFTARALKGAK